MNENLSKPLENLPSLSAAATEYFIFLGCKNLGDMVTILESCPNNPCPSIYSKRRKRLLKQVKETLKENKVDIKEISILTYIY